MRRVNLFFYLSIVLSLLVVAGARESKKEITSLENRLQLQRGYLYQLSRENEAVIAVNEGLQDEVRRLETDTNKLLQQLKDKEKEEEKRAKIIAHSSPYSDVELDLLYRLVECEAGAESEAGKIAVANVVFNRIRSDKFPDTLTEVIYQPYQFEPVTTRKIDEIEVSDETITAVNKAVAGAKSVSDDIVFFWAKWLNKNHEIWDACEIKTTIGVHHFSGEWKS